MILPLRRLLAFALGSLVLAYPTTLGLYTLYAVSGSEAAYQLSLLVHPVVFFVAALWFFRETGAAATWSSRVASASVWALVSFGVAIALHGPVYARPIVEQFAVGVLTGHLANFGAVLLAGFISRPRAEGQTP